ncbi:hypothetical protein TWF718_008126 [Orbilia javanica]|uniref:Uncharacterized protein n=1 Tax=Orbilia javanica TaxID=47235 RepID=A0AAN8N4J3_9PEZI
MNPTNNSEIPDDSLWLTPPPGGYPPPMARPGEPGFAPLGANEPSMEDQIADLRMAMGIKGNEGQEKNILAVIRDLQQKGTGAMFYQDGKPTTLEASDKSGKFPMWLQLPGQAQLTASVASYPAGPGYSNYNL